MADGFAWAQGEEGAMNWSWLCKAIGHRLMIRGDVSKPPQCSRCSYRSEAVEWPAPVADPVAGYERPFTRAEVLRMAGGDRLNAALLDSALREMIGRCAVDGS